MKKRWLLIMLAAFLVPKGGRSIEKLKPAALVQIYKEDGRYVIETDTGDRGEGYTLHRAVQDMENSADGDVFLDTAEYLLLTADAESKLPVIQEILRPGTLVCRIAVPMNTDKAAEYLDAREWNSSLLNISLGQEDIPILRQEGERFTLE